MKAGRPEAESPEPLPGESSEVIVHQEQRRRRHERGREPERAPPQQDEREKEDDRDERGASRLRSHGDRPAEREGDRPLPRRLGRSFEGEIAREEQEQGLNRLHPDVGVRPKHRAETCGQRQPEGLAPAAGEPGGPHEHDGHEGGRGKDRLHRRQPVLPNGIGTADGSSDGLESALQDHFRAAVARPVDAEIRRNAGPFRREELPAGAHRLVRVSHVSDGEGRERRVDAGDAEEQSERLGAKTRGQRHCGSA